MEEQKWNKNHNFVQVMVDHWLEFDRGAAVGVVDVEDPRSYLKP